ncbi:transglycosylase family protein [Streptacidiphilus sp. EB129]|uniref:transglycosylase family protein n=1 Tax=Streptacidiphilus sp. EB129 TaxID=3156262 RepID=UPI003518FC0E
MPFAMPVNSTGRHRKPRTSQTRRLVATGGLATAGIALPLIGATSASAASVSTWDKVANCESSGDWSINTGNGYYGGLQFSASTWSAYGGGSYASTANRASKAQQIAVAEKVLASQGPGAWPVCGPQAGLTRGGAPASVDTGTPARSTTTKSTPTKSSPTHGTTTHTGTGKHRKPTATEQSAPQSTTAQSTTQPAAQSAPQASVPGQHAVGHGGYTVKPGDTLSGIAASAHLGGGWQTLYQDNRSTVGGNPNLIYPGQQLQVG